MGTILCSTSKFSVQIVIVEHFHLQLFENLCRFFFSTECYTIKLYEVSKKFLNKGNKTIYLTKNT